MLTIIIPAAGTGTRFAEAGYAKPKPLVDVLGKPMIQRVIDNLRPIGAHRVVVVSRLDSADLQPLLRSTDQALHLSEPTEGAVDTLLQAQQYINDDSLLIANCDQLTACDIDDFIASAHRADGAIITFKSHLSHHSYVKTDDNDVIYEIAEKQVISTQAVSGVYYFQNGTDFLYHAHQVLEDDERVKSEFYVSSVLSRMIRDGQKLLAYNAPSFMLGTPQELQQFEVAIRVGRNVL